ncbi:hypothetical protein [Sulfurimonas sp. RIFOXYB12_FULL_35_9]|uniref:hypothetical protein n=1 Tax=Sulfurimonas sp. RIFOXYB12_FULL_35_9 TaxID=1802256 RepID=UPI0008C02427|nr:hypothetical protein [Sulfurimonas sp. RIFOXYB12_FULL_35_9]OHE05227.1 MAG: hypothetical protein A2345_12555 [Sulfurimonas sp. RIFOXYB12_FULL_35_9]
MNSTFMIIMSGIVIFIVGAFFGGFIYQVIRDIFFEKFDTHFQNSLNSYAKFIEEHKKNQLKHLDELKDLAEKNNKAIVQKQIYLYEIINKLDLKIQKFYEYVNTSQQSRIALENEIVKLKNIINRKTKKESLV